MAVQTLMDQLAAHVKHGDHLCVICDHAEERLAAAAQYIGDGLRQNNFVMYAADEKTTDALKQMLARQGIDVAHEIARGALKMPTAYEAYLRGGQFLPDQMYAEFEQAIDSAEAAGFAGCRFAGEPLWAVENAAMRPALIEFEMRLNALFRERKAAGLCVYDRKIWPAEVVRDVLRTHPVAVVGDLVCQRNLYYERPDLIDREGSEESQVAWMLSQLRELTMQEARLQLALEAGRLGSWELDLRTDTSVRSLRHDQIFGYSRLLPRWGYELFMQHVLPEDREQVNATFQRALSSGGTWQFECRIRRHGDGAVRWIEAHGRPDPAGATGDEIHRLLGIVADVTERKELEQALRTADRRKDEFLATLAHELRNPLAPIVNALQLTKRHCADDPELAKMQSLMDRQVRHLVRLVDDLLEVSRISTGRITLKRQPVELRTVLNAAIEASQPLIESSGHVFSVTLPGEPIALEGDPTRLAQVFLNLLNNAAKYTPRGGRIELEARRDGEQAVVQVRDNGVGIAPALIPQMFEMFVQGHAAGERAQGGLGIGLPLARELLQLHGGRIDAHSDGPGCGSVFTVRLPLAMPAPAGPAADAPSSPSPRRRWRALVVDDNVDAADSLAANLRHEGHEVHTCYDGEQALQRLRTQQAEVVVLDIGMPGLNGYEVARRVREQQPQVLLVALTGWGQEKDRERAREAGFDLHRTKPVDPGELMQSIALLLPAPAGAA